MGLSIGLCSNAGAGAGSGGGSGAGGGVPDILKTGIITSYFLSNVSFGEVEEIPDADWSCYIPNGSVTFPSSWRTSVKKIGSIHNWKNNYIYRLFYNFTALETGPEIIKVGNPGNSSSGTFEGLFMGCSNLKNAPKLIQHDCFTSGFITYIFYKCSSIKTIDTEWVLSDPVKKADSAFGGCSEVEYINLPQPFAPTDMLSCFRNCSKLKTINGVIDLKNISSNDKIESSTQMFYGCTSLEHVLIKDMFFNIWITSDFFDHDSAIYLINNSREGVDLTFAFRPSTVATLTEEEIAVATQRGITIASI